MLVPDDHPLLARLEAQWKWLTYFYNAVAARAFMAVDLAELARVDALRRAWCDRWLRERGLPVVDGGSYYVRAFTPDGPVAPHLAPRSVSDAHAIQDAFVALRAGKLGAIAGYKIALTSPQMRKFVGVDEPQAGMMLESTILQSPARVRAVKVSFEPGARTAWHTHPLGQTLYVVEGVGWVQMRGGPKREIRPGDTDWIPPAVIHWHGATSISAMTHIAIHEALDGKNVEWMEKVTEGEYQKNT